MTLICQLQRSGFTLKVPFVVAHCACHYKPFHLRLLAAEIQAIELNNVNLIATVNSKSPSAYDSWLLDVSWQDCVPL